MVARLGVLCSEHLVRWPMYACRYACCRSTELCRLEPLCESCRSSLSENELEPTVLSTEGEVMAPVLLVLDRAVTAVLVCYKQQVLLKHIVIGLIKLFKHVCYIVNSCSTTSHCQQLLNHITGSCKSTGKHEGLAFPVTQHAATICSQAL